MLLAVATILPQNISGDGTSGSPYILYNAADVDSIRYLGANKYYRLNNDIDLGVFSNWKALPRFTGVLDMAGNTISNLTIDSTADATSADSVGFFTGIAASGTAGLIKNGRFLNPSINWVNDFPSGTMHGIGTIAGFTNGFSSSQPQIDSIIVENSRIYVEHTGGDYGVNAGVGVGGLVGQTSAPSSWFRKVAVVNANIEVLMGSNDHLTPPYDGAGLGFGYGQQTLDQGVFTGRVQTYGADTQGKGMPVGGISGRRRDNVGGSSYDYVNSFVRASYIKSNEYYAGGTAGYGGVDGLEIRQCYVIIDTLLAPYPTNDLDGILYGGTSGNIIFYAVYADTQAILLDTLANGNEDFSVVSYAGTPSLDSLFLITTSAAKDQDTYAGWNFSTIWAVDTTGQINDGYPYLQWYPFKTPIVLTLASPNGGETYNWPDSTTITWSQNDDSDSTSYTLYYSINGGLSWILIDSAIVDTSYNWIIPNTNSNAVKIKVADHPNYYTYDISNANFTILPGPEIRILYPRSAFKTITLGDTTLVLIQSAQVDSLVLFFSQDSMVTWTQISGFAVDTANGFFYDTTNYVWYMYGLTTGDIYLKAVTQADTTLYFGPGDVILNDIGTQGLGTPTYCTYNGSVLTPIERWIWEDPSCGWSNPPKTARNFLINDDGTDYDVLSAVCDGACDEAAEWPIRAGLYIVSGTDTIAYTMQEFYTVIDNDSVLYKNRLYWYNPSDTSLYMNDIVNGIDSMLIADLGPYTGTGKLWRTRPLYNMQIYNVQWTKLFGDTLLASTDFESLNDPLFNPLLVMSGDGGIYSQPIGVTMTLLDQPNNQDYAEDITLAFNDPPILRYHFRGIHPKAEKR